MRHKNPFKSANNFNLRELWMIIFILGIVAFNSPFIDIFDKSETSADLPVLFTYLYSGWAAYILLIFIFSKILTYRKD